MAYIPPNTNGQSTSANSAPVVIASDQSTLIVGTNTALAGVELTRPANTTAYAVNAVVSDSTTAPTVFTFTNAARINAGSGYIVKAAIITDQKTNVAQFRLHLFQTAPTAVNDGTLFPFLYVNKAITIGYIDFPAMSTEDATSSTAAFAYWFGQVQYICAAANRNIYGILVTKTGFTPANAQKIYIELGLDSN